MLKFEFYRANASYFGKIFYYRYIGYINLLKSFLKWYLRLLLPLGLLFFLLNYFVFDQSITFKNIALKLAMMTAISIIIPIILVVLGFVILLVVVAWKFLYITGYSLLKQDEEFPIVVKIQRRLFFLDFFHPHPVISILIGFLLSFSILYLIVSFFLKYILDLDIPIFF
jgi:hypothetical protein